MSAPGEMTRSRGRARALTPRVVRRAGLSFGGRLPREPPLDDEAAHEPPAALPTPSPRSSELAWRRCKPTCDGRSGRASPPVTDVSRVRFVPCRTGHRRARPPLLPPQRCRSRAIAMGVLGGRVPPRRECRPCLNSCPDRPPTSAPSPLPPPTSNACSFDIPASWNHQLT
jgi:hypothetical protein